MTFALAPVLKLDFKHIALVEGHVVDEGQFPPPVRRRRMLENVIINIGHELAVAQFVQFAYSHIIARIEMVKLMAILTYGRLWCQLRWSVKFENICGDCKLTLSGRVECGWDIEEEIMTLLETVYQQP